MATLAQLENGLVKADAAGNVDDAKSFAAEIRRMRAVASGDMVGQIPGMPASTTQFAPKEAPPDTFLQKLTAPSETIMGVGSGLAAGIVGPIIGAGREFLTGDFGKGTGERTAKAVQEAMTYQPRSQTAQGMVQGIGQGAHALGLEALPGIGSEMNMLARGIGQAAPAANALARTVGGGVVDVGRTILKRGAPAAPEMSGMGAADLSAATLRQARNAELDVPVKMTKGDITRDFEQKKFEAEGGKASWGEPLRQQRAQANEDFLKNFDVIEGRTGAEITDRYKLGQAVDKVIVEKVARAKAEINDAYAEARTGGDMSDPVPYKTLSDYVERNASSATNAPVIKVLDAELKRLDPAGTGFIDINAMEELRSTIGRNIVDGPNLNFGPQIKTLIDSATENIGGPLYRRARMLYRNYAKEFQDTAVVEKLLSKKPGTADRAVAFEDVFDHTLLKGSRDDVRAMRKTLQTAGAEGEQAWNELQGNLVSHIKNEVLKNVSRDVRGNATTSPAKLDSIVRNLDADGKLDFIMGKVEAQKIRTLNDLAKDIYTSPPGSVNFSNTASAIAAMVDTLASAVTGVPMIPATALKYGMKKMAEKRNVNRMTEALNYNALNAQP